MSGRSYESYSTGSRTRYSAMAGDDEEAKTRAYQARETRLNSARETLDIKSNEELREQEARRKKEEADEKERQKLYDAKLVKNKITEPQVDTKRIHIVIIDNSGSNRIIAEHFKKTSSYFAGVLNTIDPASQVAFMYYSDHCDGVNINQEVDFITPNEQGDKILHSTLKHVKTASGGDAAEAFECALYEACDINFGNSEFQHLYLVTDEVAHGMGESDDSGCPVQRSWRESVTRVYETYDTFELIGCANNQRIGKLQAQFIQKPDRLLYDLIDLSSISEEIHRKAIVSNALLFLIARKTGLQTIELFLSFLYEKWIEEHIFGKDTDKRAREMIERFGKYIEADSNIVEALMKKILV